MVKCRNCVLYQMSKLEIQYNKKSSWYESHCMTLPGSNCWCGWITVYMSQSVCKFLSVCKEASLFVKCKIEKEDFYIFYMCLSGYQDGWKT